MNILFVYPFSKIANNIFTGTTTNLLRFPESLKKKHNIFILSDYINENYSEKDVLNGMKIYRLKRFFPWPIGNEYRRLFILPKLVNKIVKNHNIDIIYYLFDPANLTYLSSINITSLGIPTIFQIDMNPYMYIDWIIQKKILKRASALHSLSYFIKKLFIEKGIDGNYIYPIHNTINVKKYKPSNAKKFRKLFKIEKNEILITYVKGREHRARTFFKKIKPLLDKKYDIRYCFIGNFKKINNEFKDKNIIFTGKIPTNLLLDGLASTDIALELRGGGWTVLTRPMEYAASGCAMVSPYSIALEEQFKDEKEILYSYTHRDDGDYFSDMANTIGRLIEDKKLLKNIKKNVRKKVEKEFSYEATMKKFEHIFSKIVK